MSYVQPDGKLRILAKVPLDTTYDHTIYWNPTPGGGGVTAQRDYFLSKTKGYGTAAVSKYTLDAQSYQRVKRGYLRVGIQADDLYDCNYLMFQNTHFGAKWFYAFIKSVEYINNEVSEIEYEVDVMQTWHFEYEPEECFVEREHTTTDVIGENTVPENLEIGDYLFYDGKSTFQNIKNISDYSICIASTWQRTKTAGDWDRPADAPSGFYDGVYSGLHYTLFDLNNTDTNLTQELVGYLGGLTQQEKEEVVAIFMIPTRLIGGFSLLPNQNNSIEKIEKPKKYGWYNFIPKNNKLCTYPFTTLYVTSSDGDSAYFKYELFPGDVCNFGLKCAVGVPPELGLIPLGYSLLQSQSFPTIRVSGAANIGDSVFSYAGESLPVNYLTDTKIVFSGSPQIYTIIANTSNTITISPALVINLESNDPITKYEFPAMVVTQNAAIGDTKVFVNVTTIQHTQLAGENIQFGNDPHIYTCGLYDIENHTIDIEPPLKEAVVANTQIVQPPAIDTINNNYTLSVKNFPMCSWTTDAFKAWLAQNAGRIITGVATTVASALATGGVINATASTSPWMTQAIADARKTSTEVSAGNSIASSLMQTIPAMLQPDHAHGVSKASLGMSINEFGYHFYYARIKDEFARIIDDYFTRFGYAVKRNKKPNRNARPHWTYCKTLGCTITASIPAPDAKAICDIYNNGITFWNNASEIGRYSELDNSPVTPTP